MSQREDLEQLRQAATTTIGRLVDLLEHNPKLSEELTELESSSDIVQEFTALAMRNPTAAGQLLKMSFAALVNCRTAELARRQLSSG